MTIKSKNESNYTVFDRQTIDEQFQEIINSLKKDMSPQEIIDGLHKILVNRTMLSMLYDKNDNESTLYRITKKYDGFDPERKTSYSYPPCPKLGRANIEGNPVLYTSIDPATAIAEMKQSIEKGESIYLSKWKVKYTRETIAHWLIINSATVLDNHKLNLATQAQSTQLKEIVKNIPEKFQDGYIYAIEKLGDLFTQPGNELYHITSAYAHDILYSAKEQKVDVSMLVYPSVENKQNSINLAIHPSFVESDCMSLIEVYELKVKENNLQDEDGHVKMTIFKKGIFTGNDFSHWEQPYFEIKHIDFDNIEIITYNGYSFIGKEAYMSRINDGENTIKDWVSTAISYDQIQLMISESIEYSDAADENPLSNNIVESKTNMFMQLDHGTKISTPNGKSCVWKVKLPVKFIKEYRPV